MHKLTRWDLLAALALTILHFTSFRIESPLNGPHEVFGQDSTYILHELGAGTPYRYNPQHHLLYHALTEWGYRLVRRGAAPTVEGAHLFLQVATALTGAAFLIGILVLLAEIGLSTPRRLTLLLLAGLSVTAWFNFAGFETHGLALWAYAVVLLSVLRVARDRALTVRQAAILAAALVFAVLARLDNWRLVPLVALLLPLPSIRPARRRLAGALALAAALGCTGTLALGKAYFGVPLREVPQRILARQDRRDLRPKLARLANLDGPNLTHMGGATAVYTVMMAPGPRTFSAPLDSMLARPLSAAALASMILLWLRVAFPLGQALRRGDPFLWITAAGWVGSLLFFTWLNPVEPFLWLLEFLPLLVALVGYTLAKADRRTWVFVTAVALVTAAHNAVSFWMRYDV